MNDVYLMIGGIVAAVVAWIVSAAFFGITIGVVWGFARIAYDAVMGLIL